MHMGVGLSLTEEDGGERFNLSRGRSLTATGTHAGQKLSGSCAAIRNSPNTKHLFFLQIC